jgi:multidrug efflux system membrane fusion protein
LLRAVQLTERDLETRQLTLSQRQQAVDQREANLRIEEARLDQQRAQIARLEWRLEQAERDLERTTLLAPFTGVIRSESVEIGRLVSVNDVVATIYDDSALNVRFHTVRQPVRAPRWRGRASDRATNRRHLVDRR